MGLLRDILDLLSLCIASSWGSEAERFILPFTQKMYLSLTVKFSNNVKITTLFPINLLWQDLFTLETKSGGILKKVLSQNTRRWA